MALAMATNPQIRAQGVTRLRLFGSMARGEAGPESDVDLLIEIESAAGLGVFDLPEDVPAAASSRADRSWGARCRGSSARARKACPPSSAMPGFDFNPSDGFVRDRETRRKGSAEPCVMRARNPPASRPRAATPS